MPRLTEYQRLWIRTLALPVLLALATYLILKYIQTVPFFYLSLAWAAILLAFTLTAKGSLAKAVLWNLAFLALLLAAGEAYYAGGNLVGLNRATQTSYPYLNPSDLNTVTGYGGRKNAVGREKELYGPQVVYDVRYTTNRYGLRVTPHDLTPPGSGDYENVVFFGCSFTFGTGLNDAETLPYQFEAASGGRFRAYNFAYGGYGPHQMLRLLETGGLDQIVTDKKPVLGVYFGLIDHADRSSGKYPTFLWGPYGPKYQVDGAGRVTYAGQFLDARAARLKYRMFQELARSYLLQKTYLFQKALGWTRTPADRDLFVKIVIRSRDLFVEKYHGDFLVIFRGYKNDPDSEYVVRKLRQAGVRVVPVEEILQPYHDPQEALAIHHDGHPTRLYNQRLAAYLLSYLAGR